MATNMNYATAEVLQQQMQTQAAAAAAQEVYVELLPLTYSGAVPAPAPACTDPTPDEQHRLAIAQRHEALRQKEEARQQALTQDEEEARTRTAAAVEGNGSLTQQLTASASEMFASLKTAVSQAAMSIEKGATDVSARTEAQVRQLEYQHNCDRFRLRFPELAEQGEVLLADYGCAAMHGGLQVSGHLQITRHHLCFFAETSSSIAKATEAVMGVFAAARQAASANATSGAEPQPHLVGIKQVIPLTSIASIQPSVALETVGGQAPFFLPLPAPTVRATALQVYATSGNKLFQFLNFESLLARASGALTDTVKGTSLDRAYNYLDHAWRDAATVPLNGVEYA